MDTTLCSKDTTDDTTRSFRLEGSERAMRAAASSRSKLAPMGVSSYGGLDDGALHRPRSLGGSVPVAKLAGVVGACLLVVALGAALTVQPVKPALQMEAEPHPRLAQINTNRKEAFGAGAPEFGDGATPALGGADVVAFFSLPAGAAPVAGSAAYRHDLVTTDDQGESYESTWYFSSADHLAKFATNPGAYLPRFGGFCAFGITSEFGTDGDVGMDAADPTVGWPWSREHMGPPTDVRNWVVQDGKLYFTFLPDVMVPFLADYDDLQKVGEDRWAGWYGAQTGALPNGPMQTDCMASGYGPPVTRTCTLTPQRSASKIYETASTNVDAACLSAAFDACGAEQGSNPVADNACSDCLSANFAALSASCPATDTALHNYVDKAFCW
jgi:hypothetical protein